MIKLFNGLEIYGGERFSYVSKDLKTCGYYECYSTQKILDNVKHGMICVDVGCNIGYYTMLMLNNGGEVWFFDALLENYETTLSNVKKNFSNRLSHGANFAIGNKNGICDLYVSEECLGMNTVWPRGLNRRRTIEQRLDAHFDKIDILKVDVEGYETEVLEGLGKIKPRYILIEDNANLRKQSGRNPGDFYDLLSNYKKVSVDGNLWCELNE